MVESMIYILLVLLSIPIGLAFGLIVAILYYLILKPMREFKRTGLYESDSLGENYH